MIVEAILAGVVLALTILAVIQGRRIRELKREEERTYNRGVKHGKEGMSEELVTEAHKRYVEARKRADEAEATLNLMVDAGATTHKKREAALEPLLEEASDLAEEYKKEERRHRNRFQYGFARY